MVDVTIPVNACTDALAQLFVCALKTDGAAPSRVKIETMAGCCNRDQLEMLLADLKVRQDDYRRQVLRIQWVIDVIDAGLQEELYVHQV